MPRFTKTKKSIIPSVKTQLKTTAPSIIQLEGYLHKQKHGKCRAWLRRYFVVYEDEIRYYKNKNDKNALAVISLDHYSLVPDAQPLTSLNQKQWKPNTFCLVSDDETKFDWPDYFLQASSSQHRQVWVDCLQQQVSQSSNVLEKWLDRLHLPPQNMQALSLESNVVNKEATSSNKQDQNSAALLKLPTSSVSLPPQTYGIRNYRSAETLNTFTTHSSNDSLGRIRPSDLSPSRSSDFSTRLLSSKLFNWTRSRSNTSSCSSIVESVHTHNNESAILETPQIAPTALEPPIIHPSEYDNILENPNEYIVATSPHQDSTVKYFYTDTNLLYSEQATAH